MSLTLRERLRRRHRPLPSDLLDPPRWLREETWIPPLIGGGFEPDGHELVEATRRRYEHVPRPVMEFASPEEMAAAGWMVDQTRIAGRLA